MKSRKIAVTTAILAALASGAVFAQDMGTSSTFPPSSEDVLDRARASLEPYFAQQQRAAQEQAMSAARASVIPADNSIHPLLPTVARYFDEQTVREPDRTGAIGGAFPHQSEVDARS
jgi:hypothetical protein